MLHEQIEKYELYAFITKETKTYILLELSLIILVINVNNSYDIFLCSKFK